MEENVIHRSISVHRLFKSLKTLRGNKQKALHVLSIIYVTRALAAQRTFFDASEATYFEKPFTWNGYGDKEIESFDSFIKSTIKTLCSDTSVLCRLNEYLKFNQLHPIELRKILDACSLWFSEYQLAEKQAGAFVEEVIAELHTIFIPQDLVRLLLGMVQYQKGRTLYDPKAGTGRLVFSLIQNFQTNLNAGETGDTFIREQDPVEFIIASLIFELMCKDGLGLCLDDGVPKARKSFKVEKFNAIITFPQVKKTLQNLNPNPLTANCVFDLDAQHLHRSTPLIDHIIESLAAGGSAAIISEESTLSVTSKAELDYMFHSVTRQNSLDTVMRLPRRLFNNTALVIIILKKFKKDSQVYFLDASMSVTPDLKLDTESILQRFANKEVINGVSFLADLGALKTLNGSLIVSRYLKLNSAYITTPAEQENFIILRARTSERFERIKILTESLNK